MKNKQTNAWSFATAKLQAISRRLIAIALAALIAFSFAACGDPLGGTGGTGGTGGGALIVTGLPRQDDSWSARVYPQGYTFTTGFAADNLWYRDEIVASAGNSLGQANAFPLWDIRNNSNRWRGSGNWPVLLWKVGGSYYVATVNFTNGGATVPWSNFRQIPDYN